MSQRRKCHGVLTWWNTVAIHLGADLGCGGGRPDDVCRIGVMRALNEDRPDPDVTPRAKPAKASRIVR
ncbi:MAG: hypothetical protein E6G85_05790 [Alphaproteobacteria bacterium]|nr:MAG: hypothetical protein E6G85_05790 [Alphaproteobacteria bacterium]